MKANRRSCRLALGACRLATNIEYQCERNHEPKNGRPTATKNENGTGIKNQGTVLEPRTLPEPRVVLSAQG